jgi:hypothetical protein
MTFFKVNNFYHCSNKYSRGEILKRKKIVALNYFQPIILLKQHSPFDSVQATIAVTIP